MQSKLYCLIGKSGAGKDTLFQKLLAESHLTPLITYTTRPKRDHETEGMHYHFVDDATLRLFEEQGEIIEKREYNTTKGTWYYFTRIFALEKDILTISTPAGVREFIKHFGKEYVVVAHLHADDYTRLSRLLLREYNQSHPDYIELCRRFIADEGDFTNLDFQFININTDKPPDDCLLALKKALFV